MATKSRKKAPMAKIDDQDVTFRVAGHIVEICEICGEGSDDHDHTARGGPRCPDGTTTFVGKEPVHKISMMTNQSRSWVTIDPRTARKFFHESDAFSWGEDERECVSMVRQTAFAICVAADLEPSWIDEHMGGLYDLLMALDTWVPMDFAIRNFMEWSQNPDWDEVDWNIQDPR